MAYNKSIIEQPVEVIETEIGRRLEAARLAANISQAELAAAAGVSRRTITRLENGEGVAVNTLIRVLRALGLGERIAALLPEAEVSPIERVRLKSKARQRARPAARPAPGDWSWDDGTDGDAP